MKPEDLRALLEKASPRPWRAKWDRDDENFDIVDPNGDYPWHEDDSVHAIVALVNLAPLLIELWEAASSEIEKLQRVRAMYKADIPGSEVGIPEHPMEPIFDKLEES